MAANDSLFLLSFNFLQDVVKLEPEELFELLQHNHQTSHLPWFISTFIMSAGWNYLCGHLGSFWKRAITVAPRLSDDVRTSKQVF